MSSHSAAQGLFAPQPVSQGYAGQTAVQLPLGWNLQMDLPAVPAAVSTAPPPKRWYQRLTARPQKPQKAPKVGSLLENKLEPDG